MTQITIAGKPFNVADAYKAGHTLTENEASALNQLRRENIRNNMAGTIKKLDEAGTFDEAAAQRSVDDYAKSYEFGARTGGTRGDPVLAEATDIARQAIKANLVKAGKKLSDYSAAQITEAARKLVETKPHYKAEAQKRLKALSNLDAGDDLLAGLEPTAPVEQPAA